MAVVVDFLDYTYFVVVAVEFVVAAAVAVTGVPHSHSFGNNYLWAYLDFVGSLHILDNRRNCSLVSSHRTDLDYQSCSYCLDLLLLLDIVVLNTDSWLLCRDDPQTLDCREDLHDQSELRVLLEAVEVAVDLLVLQELHQDWRC